MKQEVKTLTNEQLLDLVRSGDDTAFHEFYRRNRTKVTGFAYRFLRDQEEAKDLTQEIFVNFWENRNKIDPTRSAEALLFVMVKNKFLDSLKRKARLFSYIEQEVQEESHACSTDNYIDFKDSNEIVSQAIETLPKQAKVIYLLSRDNGLSHQEISEQMQLSKKTVNNQITKSTRHIRRYFSRLSPETALTAILLLLQIFTPDYV